MTQLDPNQTRFSMEEPLFEQLGQIPVELPENPEPKVPLLKQKRFVIALIAGVTLVILLILFLVNAYIEEQKRIKDVGEPEPSAVPASQTADPLLRRIETIQQELKDADPSQQDLIYPTLDYVLRLDPPKKR